MKFVVFSIQTFKKWKELFLQISSPVFSAHFTNESIKYIRWHFSIPLHEHKICIICFNVYTHNLDKIDSQITSNPRPHPTGTLTLSCVRLLIPNKTCITPLYCNPPVKQTHAFQSLTYEENILYLRMHFISLIFENLDFFMLV